MNYLDWTIIILYLTGMISLSVYLGRSQSSQEDFFEENFPNLDAFIMSAEEGSAWTLLYPSFTTVVPKPDIIKVPVGYPITGGDQELADLISNWITLVKGGREFRDRFDYWIKGEGAEPREPRWSIVRNIFGWGIEKEKPDEETEKKKTE